ncbi:SufD family Fe-S cluster assembly protein [Candidatus Woesearchaeota archaeon]|nr:SufD family Fe-S cluster assembly protein [Candidatus Woesearchaeota archaeon]
MEAGEPTVKKLPNNGLFVRLPSGVSGKKSITAAEMQGTTLLVIVAEEGSELDIVSLANLSQKIDVFAKAGSKVRLTATHTSSVLGNAVAEKGASVEWTGMVVGKGKAKLDVTCSLNGEGAASRFTGIFIGNKSQHIEMTAKTVHNAPGTTSSMKAKGALKGSSRAVVQTFTKITEKAANSECSQKVELLLLSKNAGAKPIPMLEIDNCNTKASHSAFIGRLDRERLFYLKSRGLNEKEAAKLAVEGFFEPLLREIQNNGLADSLRQAIAGKG